MTRKSKLMKWVNTMLKCKVDSYPSQKNPKWNFRHRSWLCTIHEPIDCTRCIESSPLIIYDDSFDGRSLIHMFLLAGLGTLLFFHFLWTPGSFAGSLFCFLFDQHCIMGQDEQCPSCPNSEAHHAPNLIFHRWPHTPSSRNSIKSNITWVQC